GIVMPGWERTSSSAWLARVLPPRRPRVRPARRGARRRPLDGGLGFARAARAASSLLASSLSSRKRLSMSLIVLSTKAANCLPPVFSLQAISLQPYRQLIGARHSQSAAFEHLLEP